MNTDDAPARPVVADEEVQLGVDNAEVVEKTLPAAPRKRLAGSGQLDGALHAACAYVAREPAWAVLIAAAAGAGLTALALAITDRRAA